MSPQDFREMLSHDFGARHYDAGGWHWGEGTDNHYCCTFMEGTENVVMIMVQHCIFDENRNPLSPALVARWDSMGPSRGVTVTTARKWILKAILEHELGHDQ